MDIMDRIPSYYYPTTVVFIDDSERFLTTISLQLDTRLAYLTFNSPEKAFKYIEKNGESEQLVAQCLEESEESNFTMLTSSAYGLQLNLSKLYQKIYHAERFNEVSVVVVDYSMPSMTGYEFCEKLKQKKNNIKIILLTGEADESKGIEMFNEGLIDRFILKGSENFSVSVNEAILELQRIYFETHSNLIINNLSMHSLSCLKDKEFIKTFRQLCKKNDIVEYYLIERTGSFILFNFAGEPLWLVVGSDEEYNEYFDVAKDSGASEAVLKMLKERKKIPYFKNPDEYVKASGIQWEAYMHSAHKIQGHDQVYYYSLINDKNLFEINKSNILSYKDYLEKIWPPI